jgi:SLOG cluster2
MDLPDISGISDGLKASAKDDIQEQSSSRQPTPSCNVGISISDSPDIDGLGFTEFHLQDVMVEIARYLLVNNCKLIYGGDLRKGGFTYIFSELAKLYSTPQNYDTFRVANYFAWPIHINLSRVDDSEFKASNIQVVKLPPPQGILVDPDTFTKPDTNDNKVIWAKSLSNMRQTITETSQARILIGGQISNFMGIIPGLVEEALYAIRGKQPLYLCGAFGGATKATLDALVNGASRQFLSEDFQLKNTDYREFYNYWNETENIKIDYSSLVKEFSDYGIGGLSYSNGLNKDENIRLANTQHIPEMDYLIIKGMRNIKLI